MGKKGKKQRSSAPAEGGGRVAPPGETSSPPSAEVARPSSRRRRGMAFVLGLVLAAGIALALRGAGPRPDTVRRDPARSVLLITIDTLRADALGSYGHPTVATPFIDRLAAEGVRFEQAHAQNVVTLPSHANILTGRYPLDHGIRDNAGFRVPAGAETLATVLEKAGYRTAAFVSAFPLDSRFGLDRGFSVYDDRLGDPESHSAFVMQERPGQAAVAAARAWLDAQGDAKTFVWVHLYEPHFPYVPPSPFKERFANDLYHGEVSYTDALLQPLLEPRLFGRDPRTLVILTADHGEGLGEHGEATHGIFAYETTLRVPLILHAPGLLRPRVVTDRVRHIDLLPTVLDVLGLEAEAGLPGQSLLAAANGHPLPPGPSYFEAMSSALNRGWAPLAGLVRGNHKLIELPIPELYDLATDPRETKNLAATEPQRLEEIRAQLARLREADRGLTRTEENAETRARLQALGYLASAAPAAKARYTDADDPKRLIQLDTAMQEVVTLYQTGDLGSAIGRVRRVLDERPDMPLAWQHLGFLLHEVGDLDGSVESLKRSVAANPDDIDGVALLGGYLNDAGRHAETVAVLGVYARRDPPELDILQAYGAALAQVGRAAEAMAAFERATALDPSNAVTRANLGTVYLMKGDLARARALMEEALRLEPGLARAHNALGVIAQRRGATDEAIAHWKRAVDSNPKDWDTLFNLGSVLRTAGRSAEAVPYLERFAEGAPRALYAPDLDKVARWLERPAGA